MGKCLSTDLKSNVQFIFDDDNNIGKVWKHYYGFADFIQILIASNVNPDAKVSVLFFGSTAEVIHSFNDDQSSRQQVLRNTENCKFHYAGKGKATRNALEKGVEIFEQQTKKNTVKENILFFVADGPPDSGSNPCDDSVASKALLERISARNIRVIIMGIGDFDSRSMDCLDPSANKENTFIVNGFTSEDFSKLEESVRSITCPVPSTKTLDHSYSSFVGGLYYMKMYIVLLIALVIYGLYRYCVGTKHAASININMDTDYGSV